MKKPIRTTLIFGLLSALLVIPFSTIPVSLIGWVYTSKIFIVINIILYSTLLCRWGNKRTTAIFFPLLLISIVAILPLGFSTFLLLTLAVFSWIRSGICFTKAPFRGIIAEIITMVGGVGLVFIWLPHSTITTTFTIWLFFLVQTLYFFIIPEISNQTSKTTAVDPFEQSSQEMESLLNNSPGV